MPSVSTCLRRSVSTWPSVTFPPSPSQVTGSRWKSPCRTVSEAPGPTASTCRPLGRANSPRRERWWSSTRVPLKGRNHGHKVNQISELWLWLWLITNICIYMHTHIYIYVCMYDKNIIMPRMIGRRTPISNSGSKVLLVTLPGQGRWVWDSREPKEGIMTGTPICWVNWVNYHPFLPELSPISFGQLSLPPMFCSK